MPKKTKSTGKNGNGATLGFEEKLWQAADKMRGHMDAAEYKHVVLGLIFLKYISDAFQERFDALKAEEYADPEDRDEYSAANVFWVPKEARWAHLQSNAKQPTIGKIVDDAMVAIEKENSSLRGVLPKDYGRPQLDKHRLGELIDLIGTIGLGDAQSRSHDILGRVYEYFLGRFASAEGKGGGEFYTPQSVVKLLVQMIEPYKGRVYDPCCGSGGMFVQSEKFVEAHGGRVGDLAIYGQESNHTTWRLCKMNLAIRGIEGNIGEHNADTFHNNQHKDLKADFILANPPFNVSDWDGERLRDDVRWKHGAPPVGNANFAWVQHIVHHLAPTGVAGFVLANGSMSSDQSGEGEIRRSLIEGDLVDCMIALPGQLFYTTQIPVCLWFLARDKKNNKFRDRRGSTLFIDARKMGHLVDRTHREFTVEDIDRITRAYHAWRGEKDAGTYEDVKGFCRSARISEITEHHFVLTPGRYVGTEEMQDDGEPFDAKMKRLTTILDEQFNNSTQLQKKLTATFQFFIHGK
jgi:type I restriction enzyme M protein